MRPSEINADKELQKYLQGKVHSIDAEGNTNIIPFYTEGESMGVKVPDEFARISNFGDVRNFDTKMAFLKGSLILTLYVRLNSDGTIKSNRVKKILSQFEGLVSRLTTENYFFDYDPLGFMTPTTAYTSLGYSETILTIQWHTK